MAVNNTYWQERAEQRLISAEQKAIRLEKKLKREFNRVYKNIEAEIAKLYLEFADEGNLDYGTVRQQLSRTQKKQFKKDLEYFIENSKEGDFQNKLKALYKRTKLNKLEAVKASIEYEVHNLYEKYLDEELQLQLNDVLDESYYRTIFDIQQFKGYGVSFTRLSPHILEALLEFPWSGKNYSDKIWGHVHGFNGKLESILTSGIIQGKSNQKMAAELAKAAEVEYKKAVRLIRTETNFIANEATSKAYTECGVNKYKYLATLDLRTSDQCREKDGLVFLLSDKKIGVNYPPLHPHCRSTTVPDLEDLEGMRIARGADGKSYKVDRNMKYPEWYEKYVASDPAERVAEKTIKNKSADKKQYQKYQEVLGSNAPKSFDSFQQVKYNDDSGWVDIKERYRATNYIRSDRTNKNVHLGRQNKHVVGTNEYKQYANAFKNKGQYGPSKLNIGNDEVQSLVKQYSGMGELVIKNGKFTGVERILKNDKDIGIVVNNINGISKATSNFTIHYSSKGVHIVPDYPSKGGGIDA